MCWTGAESSQCEVRGVCHCKPGVMGDKCDRCQPNHFELGPEGCRLLIFSTSACTTICKSMEKLKWSPCCGRKELQSAHFEAALLSAFWLAFVIIIWGHSKVRWGHDTTAECRVIMMMIEDFFFILSSYHLYSRFSTAELWEKTM